MDTSLSGGPGRLVQLPCLVFEFEDSGAKEKKTGILFFYLEILQLHSQLSATTILCRPVSELRARFVFRATFAHARNKRSIFGINATLI